MHSPRSDDPNPVSRWVCGHAQRIDHVLRPVGRQRGGRPHGTRQNHGLRRGEQLGKKKSGFFERISAVGDDDARYGLVRTGCQHSASKNEPGGMVHILAVHLRNLPGFDLHAGETFDVIDAPR